MRVRNDQTHGVFVANYGVVPAGDEATVRDSASVRQLIEDGVLSEPAEKNDNNEEGDS